jgi:tetratricopeptide (TPR) repeat protein
MAMSKYVLAAFLAAGAGPALGAVTVIGSSSARMCFEAADAPMLPSMQSMRYCNEALDDATLSEHDLVATRVNRGILFLRRNQLDPAIADFDAAIAMDPNQPEAYLNKGSALMRRNNAEEALQLYTVALERNTSRPALAHFGRAIANEVLGNVRAAYEDYQLASQLDPNWAEPRTELRRFRIVDR